MFKICIDLLPSNKSLVTSAMFRISRKCFPAKHRKLDGFCGWFPLLFCFKFPTTPHRSELDHTSSESDIRPRGTFLGGSLGGSACNIFFQFGLMKLILFAKSFEARNWNCIKNQRKKGVSRNAGVTHLSIYEYLRRQVILEVQQLFTISRLGAPGEVGPWFLPLNYCGCGEDLFQKMPFASSL